MKTLHFDCFAGISGDMALGALVDLGLDPLLLRGELEKLGLEGWKLDFIRDQRNGITGTRAVVELEGTGDHNIHDDDPQYHYHRAHEHPHEHSHEHEHPHEHGHPHGHPHEHSHGHVQGHGPGGHAHNSWNDIRALIENASLREGAKRRALDIFTRIAQAEAQVHGKPVDDVAFHEVGALDSIIDIVGTAICLDILNPEHISCGEVELGSGTVRCAHGILPVPAPATELLVRGLPVKTGTFNKEMTTPTGAAILAASVHEFITGPASFRQFKTGIGIGTRKMDKPNVLRVSWRDYDPAGTSPAAEGTADMQRGGSGYWKTERLTLLEANIDDMTGESLGFLMERLFDAGALDVTFSPVTMKKSRPGTMVSVLCQAGKLDALRESLFRNSTTIGFREIAVERLSLDRKETAGGFGGARSKTVYLDGKELRTKIEFEDRARLARDRGISLEEAEVLIRRAAESR
ncbi:MAG: nickel pincer cofactor biosynthesis protein LarC [Treponema sp.]|jgi:uncharacterized protein (TIGR00299 family) protein|nr:nickel pincer cofactor biosynthesis protein LarC [Treponema sp.]